MTGEVSDADRSAELEGHSQECVRPGEAEDEWARFENIWPASKRVIGSLPTVERSRREYDPYGH